MKRRLLVVVSLVLALSYRPTLSQSMDLLGIDHVALQVGDLAVSAKWYEDRFGLRILHKWKDVWMIGKGNIKIGLFLVPNSKPVDDPDSRKIIQHFAFSVDGDKFLDIVDKLKLDKIKVSEVEDTGIAYSVFLKDPDGFDVEITTYHGTPPPAPAQP
ncbi:VOC family protein [Paraburkholderia hospita]|uniref:VOC family protein n=1 Tax=Paraburkholderia hospita TaxID=169430 RepID=UPI000271B673|nr:VOC family protein [Paraburkholderia hospita]EUC12343.1 Glyoxalase/bleomycin resistance protein/dioxygenase [Burkholderia sp. BT03]SKC51844.1 Catechol 2,3-dioxygenase [Paraburkholderia hospita]